MSVRYSASAQTHNITMTLGLQTAYTFGCWTRLAVDRNIESTVWSFDNNLTGTSFILQTQADGTTFMVYDDVGGVSLATGPAGVVGTWYCFYVVVSGTSGTLYYRSASQTTWTTATWTGAARTITRLLIGNDFYDEWLNGNVAAFKFWEAGLTQAEIDHESREYLPNRFANLICWYPFIKTETSDYSGNGKTLSGGTSSTTEDGPPISWHSSDIGLILPVASVGTQTANLNILNTSSSLFNPQVIQTINISALSTSSTIFNPGVSQTVQLPVINTSSTIFNSKIIQVVNTSILNTSSTVFDPTVSQGAQVTQLPVISTSSTIPSPQVIQIIQSSIIATSSTIFTPSVGQITQLPVINTSSTLFNPSSFFITQPPILSTASTVFNPSAVLLLQIITMQVLSSPTIVYNPSVPGGSGPVAGTIADRARVNMLTQLSLSEPQLLSATDLMRQVLNFGGQTLITKTDATVGEHYNRYLIIVRDT